MLIIGTGELISQHQSKRFTFYSIRKHTALAIENGTMGALVADEGLLGNESKMRFHIRNHQWSTGIPYHEYTLKSKVKNEFLSIEDNVIDVLGRRIALLRELEDSSLLDLEPDYLWVTRNIPPCKSVQRFTETTVILNPEIFGLIKEKWKQTSSCIDLQHGYYQVELNN